MNIHYQCVASASIWKAVTAFVFDFFCVASRLASNQRQKRQQLAGSKGNSCNDMRNIRSIWSHVDVTVPCTDLPPHSRSSFNGSPSSAERCLSGNHHRSAPNEQHGVHCQAAAAHYDAAHAAAAARTRVSLPLLGSACWRTAGFQHSRHLSDSGAIRHLIAQLHRMPIQ